MASNPVRTIHGGRYGLFDRRGGGNFGEVWRARDNLQGDEVAVKLLNQNVTLDAALLETQILTRLRQHERIVTIRNVELAPPMAFIVMDYLPAGSVGARLAAGGVDLVQAVRWTREALDGLAHAHDMGVLHRDIKPDNWLLDDAERAVVSDFGIAEDTVRGLLAMPQVYWPHAAPELATQASSPASDIFATGCTLYRLLTGIYPFGDPAAAAKGQFTDPHRVNPQIPMSVTRVVRQALHVDPGDRYADARAMLGALAEQEVAYCWTPFNDPAAQEAWRARGDDGVYELRVTKRSKDYEVVVKRDKGSGFRRVLRDTSQRESDALRVRRNALVSLVENGTI